MAAQHPNRKAERYIHIGVDRQDCDESQRKMAITGACFRWRGAFGPTVYKQFVEIAANNLFHLYMMIIKTSPARTKHLRLPDAISVPAPELSSEDVARTRDLQESEGQTWDQDNLVCSSSGIDVPKQFSRRRWTSPCRKTMPWSLSVTHTMGCSMPLIDISSKMLRTMRCANE